MVLPDSHEIPRVPCYLGKYCNEVADIRLREYHPLRSGFPTCSTSPTIYHSTTRQQPGHYNIPQPPHRNTCQLSHGIGLASSTFARHYSRNHYCFLFLRVLRCFTSPRSLQLPYTFRQKSPDITPDIQGYPIRTSQDHSSFSNSPRLIAGYNVLHRLLVPRHPPIALSSLPNTTQILQRCSHPL